MCVRFDSESGRLIRWSQRLRAWIPFDDWEERDTFPGDKARVLVADGRQLAEAVWGMVPPWTKDPKFGKKHAFNARAETVAEKPTFRTAFRNRRCIVPVTGFYERAGGHWIRFAPAGGGVLSLAGLLELPNDVCPSPSFALVTTEPNAVVADIQDRMPVVLTDEDVERWLDPATDAATLRALMTPCADETLTTADAGPIRKARTEETLF